MNPDDPKLTAYALDELDPAERAEIEQLLREDPAALAEVQETERFAAQLRRKLQSEPAAPLTEEQRAEVVEALAASAVVGKASSLSSGASSPGASYAQDARRDRLEARPTWRRPLALAASVALAAGVAFLALNSRHASPESQPKLAAAAQGAAEGRAPARSLPSAPEVPATDQTQRLAAVEERLSLAAPAPEPSALALNDTQEEPAAPAIAPEVAGQPAEGALAMLKSSDIFAAPAGATADSESPAPNSPTTPAVRTPAEPGVTTGESPRTAGGKASSQSESLLAPGNAMPSPVSAPVDSKVKAPAEAPRALRLDTARTGRNRQLAQTALATTELPQATTAAPARPGTPAPGGVPLYGMAFKRNETGDLDGGGEPRRRNKSDASDESLAQREPSGTEAYDAITDNAFLAVGAHPLSTFSIDVDTASYSNVRRFLNEQRLPPKGAVRIEELLNYFDYEYPQPEGDVPFSSTMEVAACPWKPEHRLVRIGLKGREIHPDKRPATNLVFLIDVSGSMQPENKLPLVKKSLRQLVDRLGGEDTVAIAVYAGASGCVLEPTNKKSEMRAALERLESGGSTNGAAGIRLAYQLAERSFIKGGVNRVILATDGDFNVGVTNQSELTALIEKKAKSGVFLTVLGFGMGNLKDSTLEKLADKGNGNYAYIDTFNEARKVLVEQMSGTLVTIAKDVKIQVEFNPAQVAAYRLIGYENRLLAKEDFNDDTKDAGEIGAGHTVTALYEVVPAGMKAPTAPDVDALKYQSAADARPERRIRIIKAADATPSPSLSLEVQPHVRGQLLPLDSPRTLTPPDAAPHREKHLLAEASAPGAGQNASASGEMLTLKLRYKAPDGDTSKLQEFPLTDDGKSYERSSRDFRFAAAVASFGMLLRDSPHKGSANWNSTLELATEGKGEDRHGYRAEFVGLIERAKAAR